MSGAPPPYPAHSATMLYDADTAAARTLSHSTGSRLQRRESHSGPSYSYSPYDRTGGGAGALGTVFPQAQMHHMPQGHPAVEPPSSAVSQFRVATWSPSAYTLKMQGFPPASHVPAFGAAPPVWVPPALAEAMYGGRGSSMPMRGAGDMYPSVSSMPLSGSSPDFRPPPSTLFQQQPPHFVSGHPEPTPAQLYGNGMPVGYGMVHGMTTSPPQQGVGGLPIHSMRSSDQGSSDGSQISRSDSRQRTAGKASARSDTASSPETRRKRRREQNRVNAARCRERKAHMVTELQLRCDALHVTNESLTNRVRRLNAVVAALQAQQDAGRESAATSKPQEVDRRADSPEHSETNHSSPKSSSTH